MFFFVIYKKAVIITPLAVKIKVISFKYNYINVYNQKAILISKLCAIMNFQFFLRANESDSGSAKQIFEWYF